MKAITLFAFAGLLLITSCSKKHTPDAPPLPPPDLTWQEHWFEHKQLLNNVYYDDDIAVYYDDDMDSSVHWPFAYIQKVWTYVKDVYGPMDGGDRKTRLYVIYHAGKYSGGHPFYYYAADHDYRNGIDCGSVDVNAWKSGTGNDLDITTHEIAHIVESTTNGAKGSPSFSVWKDSKWAEIFIYDVYKNLGLKDEEARWYHQMQQVTDNFPRAGTQWFKNWFFPIYSQYGGSAVLAKYFKLLATYFPKDATNTYERDLNYGEFVHFWSGAAGTSLKQQAILAFGWDSVWEAEFQKAKADFPDIRY